MASLKISAGSDGKPRYYVHWQDEKTGHGRRRIFKNIDDAVHLFWQRQNIELNCRNASWGGLDRSWNLRKLLYFFLGYQINKVEQNKLQISSYKKRRHSVLAVQGDILDKNILLISQRDISESVPVACQRWIRSAFFLLLEKRLIKFNPVDKPVRGRRRPITVPSRDTVRRLLDEAPLRERIACWMGICGLRLGEALAVTYSDISSEIIHIRRHIVNGVIREGLKRGVERQVRMPKELFSLLDPEKIGSPLPLVSNNFTGAPLSINYGTQGELRRVLQQYGIARFHHLRHFFVSRLAARGVDIMHVSRLAGHSSIKITFDVYGHLFCPPVNTDLD